MSTMTFEKIYPQAPFAELIRLGIALAKTLARRRDNSSQSVIPPHAAMSH